MTCWYFADQNDFSYKTFAKPLNGYIINPVLMMSVYLSVRLCQFVCRKKRVHINAVFSKISIS